jgi:hypothetical protein
VKESSIDFKVTLKDQFTERVEGVRAAIWDGVPADLV